MPPNPLNELAKERNRAAAERTLTAWIQNCLLLIGFGVAFDQIFAAMRRAFPDADSTLTREFATGVGLGAIATGLIILALVAVEYPIKLRAVERKDYLYSPINPSVAIAIAAIALFGLIALITVLLNSTG